VRSLPIFRSLPAAVAGISIGGVAICYLLPVYGIQWVLDLCNGIVEEGSIPEDWKSSVVLPIYKGKGNPMECGSY